MDNFKVGEIALFAFSDLPPFPGAIPEPWTHKYDGQDCEVVGGSCGQPGCDYHICFSDGIVKGTGVSSLRKKRPPAEYDGNQLGSWDSCPFKPAALVELGR